MVTNIGLIYFLIFFIQKQKKKEKWKKIILC